MFREGVLGGDWLGISPSGWSIREKRNPPDVLNPPNADWSRYDSVVIDSVSLWITGKSDRKLSDQDRQMLTDTVYKALHDALSEYFVIVDYPQPDAVRLRAALTEVKGANVATRTLTTVVPQLRLASTIAGLGADVASTVGTATVEVEVLDSVTGVRLAAAVDSRAGNKALFSGRTFQKWGDFEAAAQHWAKRAAYRLATFGVRRKPGAPMPEA